jgi:3-oxoadipate enol-lactonase
MKVHWQSHGVGPALLLLHAFPFDSSMWNGTVEALSDRYRVITLDQRGFGASGIDGPASLETIADDAATVLDEAGVPMAVVGGLSMGGYVALAFARRHAARLTALILADTRAGADSAETRKARDAGIAELREKGVEVYVAPHPARLLAAATPEALERALAIARRQSADGIANALAAMRDRPDRSGELTAIRCPALVVVGSADAITPPAEARAMAAQIRGARFVEIPGAGHLSSFDAAEAFNAALGEFLDEVFPE